MGDYTGIHLDLKFKPEQPPKIIELINQLSTIVPKDKLFGDAFDELFEVYKKTAVLIYGIIHKPPAGLEKSDLEASLKSILVRVSSYFPNWNHFVSTVKDGQVTSFRSWASIKDVPWDTVAALLQYLHPYLDVKHGDILVHTLYEEDSYEHVIWYNEELELFMVGEGCIYHSWEDDNHGMGHYIAAEEDTKPSKPDNPKYFNRSELAAQPSQTIQQALESCGKPLRVMNQAGILVVL